MNEYSAWLEPKRLLKISVVVALITIVTKAFAWHVTGSVSLLSDAAESVINLATALFAWLMLDIAQRPADDDHPYGHHKAEYFSAAFEGMLILVAAAGIAWTGVYRLLHPQPLEQLGWGMALTVGSTALNGVLAWCMFKGAKLHRSIALEGEGHHLMVDVWTSMGVVVGLLLVQWLHWTWLDPVAALLVAVNILKEGVRLLWRSSQGLMDEAAPPEVQQKIERILSAWRLQYGDQIRVDHLRTRQVGAHTELDLHVHLPENWTLAQAAALRSELVQNLTQHIGELKTTVQLLPINVEA